MATPYCGRNIHMAVLDRPNDPGLQRDDAVRRTSDPIVQRLQGYFHPRHRRLALVVLTLGAFCAIALYTARVLTPTVDEFVYVPAGYYHLRTGDLTLDPTNPPLLKMLMALPLLAMDVDFDSDPRWRDNRTGWGPWIFGTRFMETNRAHYLDAFFAARAVVVVLGVVTGVLVWWRARELLTPVAALATLLLYCTLPPMIAHGALATLDMGVTALLFATFVALARFTATRERPWAVVTGVLAGLAFVAKGVTLIFVPLVPLLAALEWRRWDRESALRFIDGMVVVAVSAWIAILAVYGFSGFPLPGPVLEGIRFQLHASSAGEYPAFLNGQWSQTGWWYYFFEALVLKTPLPTLALIAIGAWTVARRRARGPGDLWILLPPLLLLYVLSFHFGKNYGVRYLLPAFPFLVLLAGIGVDVLLRGRRSAVLLGTLLLWQVVASTVNTPHSLAYFNELAGSPDHARRLLLDSNLDWGQDLGRLREYMDANRLDRICLGYFGHVDPKLYGIEYSLPPTEPTPGRCAVSANFLAGYPYALTYTGGRMTGVRRGAWSWFDRLEPVARVGRSIYVFDVTAADVQRLQGAAGATSGTP